MKWIENVLAPYLRIANDLRSITQQPNANDIFVTLAAVRRHWLVWQRFSHNDRTQCSSTLVNIMIRKGPQFSGGIFDSHRPLHSQCHDPRSTLKFYRAFSGRAIPTDLTLTDSPLPRKPACTADLAPQRFIGTIPIIFSLIWAAWSFGLIYEMVNCLVGVILK